MNPVVHFEMPYEDKDRAAKFYATAFGWKSQIMGPEMGEYMVMQTGETDAKGMVKNPGNINGGMYNKSINNSPTSVVIAVTDIRAAMKKIEEAGGKIVGGQTLGEPDNIPGVGLYISFVDTEGNKASVLQPTDMPMQHHA